MKKDSVAKLLTMLGLLLIIGSVGACENEDYSILEAVATSGIGYVLTLTGWSRMEESNGEYTGL